MSRERKPNSALRAMPAVFAFLLCLFLGGAGIGYVWQKNQLYELSIQIREAEFHLEKLERQNQKLANHLAFLCSPRELDSRVKRLHLGLVQPQQEQILWLPEAPAEPQPSSHGASSDKSLIALTVKKRP